MFRLGILCIGLLFLSACGGGGGGGGGSNLFITNEQFLPGISGVIQPTSAGGGTGKTRLYVNDIPNTRHEGWVRDVVHRLHPDDDVLITDYRRGDREADFNVFRNYFEQGSDVVTVLPRGYENTPHLMISNLATIARDNSINYNSLGLLVLSAGNEGISFTNGLRFDSRNGFLKYLERKRSIIAVGTNSFGTLHRSSNYCEDWYKEYCVGASYEFTTSDGYQVAGTSFSAPVIGVAAAIMKEQFDLTAEQTFELTTECAKRNPAGRGMIGAINLR